MYRRALNALLASSVLTCSLSAAPKIEFDKTVFQCGSVVEGKTEKVAARFVVRNTGNESLALKARPGCGCTVVKYDSTVAPGASTTIESSVNIKGLRGGPMTKTITVTSNAANEPSVKLEIQATIEATIDVSEGFVNMSAAENAPPHTIVLASRRTGLKVLDVSFRIAQGEGPSWQANMPVPVKYSLTPTASTRPDGLHVYKLALTTPAAKEASYGDLVIKTDHPDKPEITVRAQIVR
jgi:hypothetical protein